VPQQTGFREPDYSGKNQNAQQAGVKFSACKACADQLGVADKLTELDIDVIFWGEGMTEILKNGEKLLTI
jgi:hypothetical protein